MARSKASFDKLNMVLLALESNGKVPSRKSEEEVFDNLGWTRSQYQTKAQKFDEETFLKFEDYHDCT